MKLSVIWIWSQNQDWNKKTENCLKTELATPGLSSEIFLYCAPDHVQVDAALGKVEKIAGFGDTSEAEVYNDAMTRVGGDYVTVMFSGDTWEAGSLKAVQNQANVRSIIMMKKIMPSGQEGAFATDVLPKNVLVQKLWEKFTCYPFYFGGTFVKKDLFLSHSFDPSLGLEAERKYFLDICAEKKEILYIANAIYHSNVEQEGDPTFYPGLYEEDFYIPSMRDFWIPYLEELTVKYGKVPEFIQHHLVFTVMDRFTANANNKNKHVMEEGDELEFLNLIQKAFSYVEDRNLFDARKVKESNSSDSMKWILGVLKYGENYRFQKGYVGGKPYYGGGETFFNKIENLKTNIVFMDYENEFLEIDGTIHPILYSMAEEIFFTFNGVKYRLNYNERYAHTKAFGVGLFKSHSFHVSIPMKEIGNGMLFCFAKVGSEPVKILFTFQSHFSRMSGSFKNSYWCFGPEQKYMMLKKENGLAVALCDVKERRKQELRLMKETLLDKKNRKKNILFAAVRLAYFAVRPIMKKRPIWMYIDKIYKGGDSSEYLYRYASAQDNNFRHYYLVDKKATDYQRLKKDGYKPLVRGTFWHRLVFLLSDMMVISNSTVCAFNGFDMVNSGYVRDLINFHVCCVQHGMSVQKIAVAQNRLRDNTRLYFCASKYELRNLNRPIYDYKGYNALRLTGVPRYDGLVNKDQKQIMISPTWRMQAAVPVRTSESEQRDYNPLFKESMYYKVFNALINDPRLIEAAKKYGYKIKYVLHPIVSSQVDDFDKNEFVDIIPAVGDMSYEKMFCESSLMVTDFSGIQFDFAYMRKPLVYLHHKDIPQHYEEGSFFYDTMAFGEICHDNDELIDTLIEYMSTGCQMKEEYVQRADDFFYYSDHDNCKRIYEEMLDYQDRYVLHKKPIPDNVWNFSRRKGLEEETKQILRKNKVSLPGGKNLTDYYFDAQLDDKMVLLLGLGHSVRGSLQYILNELNYSPEYEGFTVYVRTGPDSEEIVKNYIRQNNWTRTRTVLADNDYSRVMETAKYLLTEVYFPEGWIRKPGQVCINIWHGTPLKKLGLAKNSSNIHKDGNTQKNFINADYLLYPNDYTRENMLASYKVADLMQGRAAMIGYPRTGGMIQAAHSDLTEVRKILAPHGEKIYVYMPTWKDYLKVDQVVDESKELLDYLDANLREDQILYVNLHHKVSDSLDYSGFKHIRKFPPLVDSYTLLAASDALITDYSSVFYDYLALQKQIVLYCADYELYREKRGTYMDLMSLPFDKARTSAEVLEALNRGKTYEDEEAYQTFCAYDSEENAKQLCHLFLHKEEPGRVSWIRNRMRKQTLVFSERCNASAATTLLQEAAHTYDRDRMEMYVGCDMNQVDKHKKSAYPMLHEVPAFGMVPNTHLSSLGRRMLKLYQDGKLSFADMMRYVKYDFAADSLRMFGEAQFDTVAIYEVLDPETLIALSLMEGRKVLFLTGDMLKKAGEDTFMKDAICFAITAADEICTVEADCMDAIRKLAEGSKVSCPANAEELLKVLA